MPGSERRLAAVLLLSLAGGSLLALAIVMVLQRILLPVGSPGFRPEAFSWLSVLFGGVGDLPAWCTVCAFCVSVLAMYALVGLRGVPTVSRLLALAMTALAVLAFAVQLLPQRLIDGMGHVVEPLGHCEGEPVSAWTDFPERALYWLLLVFASLAAAQIGLRLTGDRARSRHATIEWAGVWLLSLLAALIAVQNSDTTIPESLVRGLPPWSCWGALAGMFLGWGGTPHPTRSTDSPPEGRDSDVPMAS